MYFSVIVPTYQDGDKLYTLLEAISRQSFKTSPWEVIIVNNDPEPDLSISRKFSFPFRILHELKPGSYAARNNGLEHAKGKIIAFTDADMLPDRNWLEIAYHNFDKDLNNEIGILTGPVPLFYKKPAQLTDAEIYEKYTGFDFEGYTKEGACGAGNWFSYKSVLEEFGGFREDLKSNGDTELSLRISQKYKVVYVSELVNQHPARYHTAELVSRYQRILGGTFQRKYQDNKSGFLGHTLSFIFRRYRFSLKKFFTVPIHESWAIFKVCNAINWGAVQEYLSLVRGGETKR
ncbi:glycosyltransferase family 2 protein [Algoriphagus sp. AGSA1]|uniref:glycosyltransferase n=1 Tax=Algoriphagus sp. AGSA1 TaxID=2907213 RepID=UPI001F31403C|nr:glycosyltransferase family A protein [Algoriphagus sp. AGSA1]MCE7054129.1 glycosyltransferase family 2 protein [Algoriphagus sp. AGSA1]